MRLRIVLAALAAVFTLAAMATPALAAHAAAPGRASVTATAAGALAVAMPVHRAAVKMATRLAGRARAGLSRARRALRRACTWSTSTSFANGPPGSASITVHSESPAGCEQFRVNITSSNLDCVSGSGPVHCRFTSGWIKGNNLTSSVSTCQLSTDCGSLNTAYEDRRPTGTTTWQCRNLIAGGSWRNCSANLHG